MKLHLKPSRGNNSESMKARVVILVRDRRMDGQRTDGWTDGRQTHLYIPRTYRSGDKKESKLS